MRLTRTLAFLAAAFVIAIAMTAAPAHATKYASIIVDARTGAVLHERHAAEMRYPASLTKVMTLLLAFDALKAGRLHLNQEFTTSARAAAQQPSKLGLRAGQKISVGDLILSLVTRSANDAAVVLAEGMAGTEAAFARQMTERARGLGMKDTTFRNAHGLPDSRQRTTARDMAKLAMAMLRLHPDRYHYFSVQSFRWNGQTYNNHNHLLRSYTGADGMKTGYIRASGYNLITTAERDGRRLIGIVFGGRTGASRNAHMATLLDNAFSTLRGDPNAIQKAVRSIQLPTLVASAQAAAPVPLPRPRPSTGIQLLAHALTTRDPADGSDFADGQTLGLQTGGTAEAMGDAAGPGRRLTASALRSEEPHWAIQVGAFRGLDNARQRAAAAAAQAPGLLAADQVRIMPIDTDSGRIYRARLIGLSQTGAIAACRQLLHREFSCITLSPDAS